MLAGAGPNMEVLAVAFKLTSGLARWRGAATDTSARRRGISVLAGQPCDLTEPVRLHSDDLISSCFGQLGELPPGFDILGMGAGIASEFECFVDLSVGVSPDTPPGDYIVPLTIDYDYFDGFFERDESVSELRDLRVRPDEYLFPASSTAEAEREANYWTFIIAICQHTKSLQGWIDGQWCRGWDYLVRASRRVVDEVASAEAMADIDAGRLQAIFSDDFDAAHSTLNRIDERLGQLHNVAQVLLERYDGQAMNLFRAAGGRIQAQGGIFDRLAAMAPYTDPLDQTAPLLVGQLDAAGA